MLSKIFALLGSCSNRTNWLSTVSRLSPVSVRNSRNKSSMKLAFAPTGTRHRRALRNLASFYAKGLILVEQMEKNGLNKEIRPAAMNPAAGCQPLVNLHGVAAGTQAADTITFSPSGASV